MNRVVLVAFDGATTLDVVGPAEVFAAAATETPYRVVIASRGGGLIASSAKVSMQTANLLSLRPLKTDTVIVAGGVEAATLAAMSDRALLDWVARAAPRVRRIGSVCSGAFVLAAAGVLDDKRATTHWSACQRLAQMFPSVKVDSQAIYVTDGHTWTSAGVSTGIDMALSMVQQDYGSRVADEVANSLVLYLRRPGFQSQFSPALWAQVSSAQPLGQVVAWVRSHLHDANVETIARACALSVRTLHRQCSAALGTTPGKLVEQLRLERARTLLVSSNSPIKAVAHECGFKTITNLRRAFERETGLSPREYRLLHQKDEHRKPSHD